MRKALHLSECMRKTLRLGGCKHVARCMHNCTRVLCVCVVCVCVCACVRCVCVCVCMCVCMCACVRACVCALCDDAPSSGLASAFCPRTLPTYPSTPLPSSGWPTFSFMLVRHFCCNVNTRPPHLTCFCSITVTRSAPRPHIHLAWWQHVGCSRTPVRTYTWLDGSMWVAAAPPPDWRESTPSDADQADLSHRAEPPLRPHHSQVSPPNLLTGLTTLTSSQASPPSPLVRITQGLSV